MENIKDIIRKRRSVRTFDGKPLSDDDKNKLAESFKEMKNPFGIEVEFRILDAKEHKLSSPVIVGTDCYVGAKINTCPHFEIALGYSFEKFCLCATSCGLGTVMLGGTFNRKSFEKAMELAENEVMPVASPVGYPAKKQSVREKLMRKAVKADERLPFEKLFFENSFAKGLISESAGQFADALEMVRLAPSAVNKQPWRAVICDNCVHFFKKKSLNAAGTFDIQKIDIGIALAHFDLTLKESGIEGRFVDCKPDFEVDGSTEYIITYIV
ncbi:MAG: nitroreductase [Clostridiales bacterium]|nr:nitroreductase [Clostridiales bacterium]